MKQVRNIRLRNYWSIICILLLCNFSSFAVTGYTGTDFTGTEGAGNAISPANSGGTTSIIRNTGWDDFEYNMTTYSTPANNMAAGIVFRHTSNSSYYAVTIGLQGDGVTYNIRLKNNAHGDVLATTGDLGAYSQASAVTSLKILVVGSSIKVYVNGTLRIDVTSTTHTTGNVGFIKTASWNCASVVWNSPTWTQVISAVAPTVTTTAHSGVTSTTASSGGNVTSNGGGTISARGVCYKTSATPTISDSKIVDGSPGTGAFTSSLTSLSPATTYYYRAYATNEAGTSYGSESNFTTLPVVATLTTTAASSITCSGASSGGTISSNGGAAVTASGICWNTGGTPTTADSKTTDGGASGAFTSSASGLTAGVTYYIRAYATNSAGTAYGSQVSFTALSSTVAGSIGTAQTICYNGTPAGLTNVSVPTGGDGSYSYTWENSTDNSSWSTIGSATNSTYSPGALTQNTYYRRVASSSNCGTANSASILVTVSPTSVAGTVSSSATVCEGSSGTLTLSAYTGNVLRWESSPTDWGATTTIANTTTSQGYTSVTSTISYRAVVQSGVCPESSTSAVTITVTPALDPGVIEF